MAKVNIGDIDFTQEEKGFISSVINRYGKGGHPVCDDKTFPFFTISYVKPLVNSVDLKYVQPKFREMVEGIREKFVTNLN